LTLAIVCNLIYWNMLSLLPLAYFQLICILCGFTATAAVQHSAEGSCDLEDGRICGPSARRTTNATKENVWASLSEDETGKLDSWLLAWANISITWPFTVNGTSFSNLFSPSASYIVPLLYDYEILLPNKSDAIAYLDSSGPLPSRNAQFLCHVRDTGKTWLQHYSVGPLPVNNRTVVHPLNIATSGNPKLFMSNDSADSEMRGPGWLWSLPGFWNISASLHDIAVDLVGLVRIWTAAFCYEPNRHFSQVLIVLEREQCDEKATSGQSG
jgi:hypothetical protein